MHGPGGFKKMESAGLKRKLPFLNVHTTGKKGEGVVTAIDLQVTRANAVWVKKKGWEAEPNNVLMTNQFPISLEHFFSNKQRVALEIEIR